MNHVPVPFIRACCGAGLLALVAGCVDSNSRTTIGETPDAVTLTAMEPTKPIPDEYPQDAHSLTGLSRDNWQSEAFLVPVDGTGHRPTYADSFFIADVTRRQRGEYPTIESALDFNGSKYGDTASNQRFEEGFLVPARAFVDAISIPVRLIGEPQTWVYYSPRLDYQRQPVNRGLLMAPLPITTEPPKVDLQPDPMLKDGDLPASDVGPAKDPR